MIKIILQKSCIFVAILLLTMLMLACSSSNNGGDNSSNPPSGTQVELTVGGGSAVVLPNGTTQPFVASLSNSESDTVEWVWSVKPSDAGVFVDSNSSSTVFVAGQQELNVTFKVQAYVQGKEYSKVGSIIIALPQTPPHSYPEFEVTPEIWVPNIDTTPGAAKSRLQRYLSRQDYEELFPNRYGHGEWYPNKPELQPKFDYYSYDNLLNAIEKVANIVVITRARDENGSPSGWFTQDIILHKNNGTTAYEIYKNPEFDEDWIQSRPIHTQVVDFGEFLNHKLENDNKREIATMLAHMTQETSGGSGVEDRIAKALWFNEEMGYEGSTNPNYVDAGNTRWPAVLGKSYHGRGPKQLSWNYNYGLFSEIFYLDKSILLDNPEKLVQDGELGFMTAIAFYMTPQLPKASMHQVIDSNFVFSNPADEGRFEPGFGLTIIIINGGFEAGLTEADPRVATRVGAYRNICARNGANIVGEKLDTYGMGTWA